MNDINRILILAPHTDDEALQSLVHGFAVNPMFVNYRFDDLSTIQLRVALKVG